MSRTTFPLKRPASIKAAAARLAKEDGVSLNQWIAAAGAQKVGAVETAAEILKRRSAGCTLEDLHAILAAVPAHLPEDEDALPDGRSPGPPAR